MTHLSHYNATELKLVYRVLHTQLMTQPDLLDSQLFEDLQTWLRTCASTDGVDTSDHGQWDAWLSGAKPAYRGLALL